MKGGRLMKELVNSLANKSGTSNCPIICQCSKDEYQDFLIGEYGAEKVLRIQQEEREREEWLKTVDWSTILLGLATLAASNAMSKEKNKDGC